MKAGFQQRLQKWFATEPGNTVFQQEKRLLDSALANLFGYFLVQLGAIAKADLLTQSRIQTKLLVDDQSVYVPKDNLFIQAELDFLPIGKEKIDVVVLPHTLEAVEDPYFVLRQVDNMLLPEGYMVISGFNPMGCMPLRLRFLSANNLFNKVQLRRVQQIKEWLRVLGYDTQTVQYSKVMCFSRHEQHKRWGRLVEKLESFLQVLGLNFGNVYCIVAKKSVDSPTLVGMRWHLPKWQGLRGRQAAPQRDLIHETCLWFATQQTP